VTQGGDTLLQAWPTSGRVEPGAAYRYSLGRHCGITAFVDFDGSFWDLLEPPGSGDPLTIDGPTDTGVIVLVGSDRAAFDSETGVWLWFARHLGPQAGDVCY
jgi:hypothetical protein